MMSQVISKHGISQQFSSWRLSTNPKSRPAHITRAAAGGSILREVLTPAQRKKLNPDDDRNWYSFPRIVHHSDDTFRSQVTEIYRQRIPEGADILDLCSSWVSHLPKDKKYGRVVGHGLNAEELAKNPVLDSWFVRNLNDEPDAFSFPDQSFDAILCCCSVQYMQQPERVFAEMYRLLKPSGVVIITFTNRLFYEKAISAWRDASGYERAQLVKQYFYAVEGFTPPEALNQINVPKPENLLDLVSQKFQLLLKQGMNDPFYAVIAYRDFKPTN